MSAIDVENLKSVNDDKIPFQTFPEPIGTTEIKFDTLFRFGKIIKKGRIINDDGTNNITFRVGSIQSPIQTIPPKSDESFDGWVSKIFITPDGVTGKGLLELDLVNSKDARQEVKK